MEAGNTRRKEVRQQPIITNEELNSALYNKLFEEQEAYREWLLTQPPEEILNHTYEYTVREDILMTFETNTLTDEQTAALLKHGTSIADLYKAFSQIETSYMEILRDLVENEANDLIREAEKLKTLPIYYHSGEYARENGELEKSRESRAANIGCRDAIQEAITISCRNSRINKKNEGEAIATTRIIPMHLNKGKTLAQCLHDRTAYAMNPEKTKEQELISAYECDPRTIENEFLLAKREYQLLTGRRQKNDVIAYQIRQSFKPGEITPEEANQVGYELATRFLKGKYPFIVCTHIDKAHIHNHIIFSSTALDCKRKFRNFFNSSFAIRKLSDLICTEHHLSVIEHPTGRGKSYNIWQGQKPKLSHREQIRLAIDNALARKPATFEELLSLLSASGCEIKPGNNPSIRMGKDRRFARFDTLGPGYSAEDLRAIIAGKKKVPQRKPPRQEKQKPVNLLVDIRAKMQQGKGPGYEHWAKSFNLKQMAQTVLYLQKHDLLQYSELAKRVDSSSERFHQLSEEIKYVEKRMAELSVMRTHIINYAKTRDTYVDYRKAGYSKKFLSEHEPDILLHKAAKTYFDNAVMKKLPSVKEINAEFAELMAKKKSAYSEYREAKEEMQELLIVKANVDRILGIEKEETTEKEAPPPSRS